MDELDSEHQKDYLFMFGEEIYWTKTILNNCCQHQEMPDIMPEY
jgi:hypothetical protein